VYLGFRCGRVVVTAGVSVCLDFEKQIQAKEITHEALINRSMAVRMRSPLSPAATQTAFRVTIRHTASVRTVEIAISVTFLSGERCSRCDLSIWTTLSGLEIRIAECIGSIAVVVKGRNVFFNSDKQNLNQRPIALPIASAPKYSSQSNHGRMSNHPSDGYFSPFSRRMPDSRSYGSGKS